MVKFSLGRSRKHRDKPTTIVGKLGISVFFSLFFGMGMLFEVLMIHEFAKAVGQRFWEKTPCTILAANVAEDPKSDEPYKFTVTYKYEFCIVMIF